MKTWLETYRKIKIKLLCNYFLLIYFLNKSIYLTRLVAFLSVYCLTTQNVSFLLFLISFLLGWGYTILIALQKGPGKPYTGHTLPGITAIFLYVFYSFSNLELWGGKIYTLGFTYILRKHSLSGWLQSLITVHPCM